MKKEIFCLAGENIKSFLQKKGYRMFYCGGSGTCGKCKAQVLEGNAGELTKAEKNILTSEEIAGHIRLLCQIEAVTDIKISIQVEEKKEDSKHFFPYGKMIEQKEENAEKRKGFGAAFDIGTTTVAGKLFDLDKKRAIAEMTAWNLQGCFGADVITRMQYCLEQPNGSKDMQEKIAECLDKILKSFKEKIAAEYQNQNKKKTAEGFQEKIKTEISSITAAGNSAMTHFLLGQKVDSLAKAPFHPFFTEGQKRKGKECGLKQAEYAELFTLPLLQGQVGGDITAALLSIDIFSKPNNTILIDIGTNGEIAFFRDGVIYICSTAAGPALEGSGISCGMRAELGAIERVWLAGGEVYTKVIGNMPAQGICGSALIDAIAILLELGKIHKDGYLDGGSFILTNKIGNNISIDNSYIKIVQEDIRQYQMVKGAIRAGVETLIHVAYAEIEEIEQIYIAGSFGSNIQKQNAIRTGLLPEISPNKITIIGNASLQGASMALLSEESKQYAERIRNAAVLVNLAEKKEFQERYINYMNF